MLFRSSAEPQNYRVTFPDLKVLEFQFVGIQLNRLSWRDFLTQHNPVAAALMAKMNIAVSERPQVKAECLRLLTTLRLDPARMQLISGLIDTYLRLDDTEKQVFQAAISTMGLSRCVRINLTMQRNVNSLKTLRLFRFTSLNSQ